MKPSKVYGNEDVVSAAKKRKDGGRTGLKSGGAAAAKRMDGGRAGRATGGGCEHNPYSSAGSFDRGGPHSKSGV